MTDPTLDYLISRAEYGNRAASTLDQLNELHHPVDGDEHARRRCASCVCGYDPQTGTLVFAAWPCATAQILQRTARERSAV